ncbi:MAG: phosphatase PAP2 family protein, partial [Ferruginibacter sp.]
FSSDHPAWYSVLSIACYLLIFMAIVAVVITLLRGPLRKHKEYDLKVFQKLKPLHTPANNRIMQAITYLGKHQFLIPANLLLIGTFFFLSPHHWYAFDILVLSLSSLLLMLLLKRLFGRARPETPLLFAAKGKSFPSGHAMMSVCFYGFLLHILLLSTAAPGLQVIFGIICILLILLIGFSRVYLQVHYVTDVLAGYIIGCAWLYIALQVLNKLEEAQVV